MTMNGKVQTLVPVQTDLILDFSGYSWGEAKAYSLSGIEEDAIESIALVLAKVVKSVPESWLVEEAPFNLDWTDPESFDYLQSPKMVKIQHEIADLAFEGKPVFTFERLSYKDEKELARLYEEERDTENTPAKAKRLIQAQELLLCKTVLDVPRSWLVADAPANLNWRDRASYNYLQQPAYKAIMQALAEAKEEAGK